MLQKLVDSYNKSWHTGILSEPINVNKEMKTDCGGRYIGQKIKELKKNQRIKKLNSYLKLVIKLE